MLFWPENKTNIPNVAPRGRIRKIKTESNKRITNNVEEYNFLKHKQLRFIW